MGAADAQTGVISASDADSEQGSTTSEAMIRDMQPQTPNAFADIRQFVFGSDVAPDIVNAWRQGFVFCDTPPFGLVQYKGGPCAVLAPVQAHVLDRVLYGASDDVSDVRPGWLEVSPEERTQALASALAKIIAQATSPDHNPTLVLEEGAFPHESFDDFHASLVSLEVDSAEELEVLIMASMDQFVAKNGVLLLLYSVIMSRTLEQVRADIGEDEEAGQPLVAAFGHASQSLVNLLLHGHAVPHVWDGDIDTGGLILKGTPRQSDIGFLTVLEALHYCEVGSLLKSPRRPIWVVGSETHFTTLFSDVPELTSPEPKHARAKRIFQRFDAEKNGFILTAQAPDVLREVAKQGASSIIGATPTEAEVQAIVRRLDPDNGGIVLLTDFLNIVAKADPGERTAKIPTEFKLYHYNGLSRSVATSVPTFTSGMARYTGSGDCGGHDVVACLRTKWRGLDVRWDRGEEPSLN